MDERKEGWAWRKGRGGEEEEEEQQQQRKKVNMKPRVLWVILFFFMCVCVCGCGCREISAAFMLASAFWCHLAPPALTEDGKLIRFDSANRSLRCRMTGELETGIGDGLAADWIIRWVPVATVRGR